MLLTMDRAYNLAKREHRKRAAVDYLGERTGTYEYRTQRYSAVYELMQPSDDDLIMDLGAGYGDFDYFLRHDREYRGRYLPVDAALDGTDLENYRIPTAADYIVAIELIEHLYTADLLIPQMQFLARKRAILTTPNAAVQDVLTLDRTHVQGFHAEELRGLGWTVEVRSFFGKPNDSLLAWT